MREKQRERERTKDSVCVFVCEKATISDELELERRIGSEICKRHSRKASHVMLHLRDKEEEGEEHKIKVISE